MKDKSKLEWLKDELMFNILLLGGSINVVAILILFNMVTSIQMNTISMFIITLFLISVILRYFCLSLNYIYTRIRVNKKKIKN